MESYNYKNDLSVEGGTVLTREANAVYTRKLSTKKLRYLSKDHNTYIILDGNVTYCQDFPPRPYTMRFFLYVLNAHPVKTTCSLALSLFNIL